MGTEKRKMQKPCYETCVLCGKETKVLITTPVQHREGYIEGAGQLCMECFRKMLYPTG